MLDERERSPRRSSHQSVPCLLFCHCNSTCTRYYSPLWLRGVDCCSTTRSTGTARLSGQRSTQPMQSCILPSCGPIHAHAIRLSEGTAGTLRAAVCRPTRPSLALRPVYSEHRGSGKCAKPSQTSASSLVGSASAGCANSAGPTPESFSRRTRASSSSRHCSMAKQPVPALGATRHCGFSAAARRTEADVRPGSIWTPQHYREGGSRAPLSERAKKHATSRHVTSRHATSRHVTSHHLGHRQVVVIIKQACAFLWRDAKMVL